MAGRERFVSGARRLAEYNEQRPHDSLEDLTPIEHRQQTAGSSTFEVSVWRGSLRKHALD